MFKNLTRWFRRPRDPSGYVYYARLSTPQGQFYKLGYTSKRSLKERMSFSGHGDERLIDREFLFTFRKDAWDVEQKLLDFFHKHRAFGKYSNDPAMPLAGRGQSELFAHDVLGLDDDLYRLSVEEQEVRRSNLAQANDGCLMVLFGLVLAPFTLGISLLFIAGGTSGIFASSGKRLSAKKRPQHPAKIQELIDSLVQSQSMSNQAATPNPSIERTVVGKPPTAAHVER